MIVVTAVVVFLDRLLTAVNLTPSVVFACSPVAISFSSVAIF